MSVAWLAEPARGSAAAIGLITWLALKVGRSATRWLLPPICLYYYAFAPRSRRASRAYLARVLAREVGARDVLRHHHAFASTVLDRVFLVCGRHEGFDITVHGVAEVHRHLSAGRGCILLGSHLGSFEVLRSLGRFNNRAVNVLMREANSDTTLKVLARLDPELRQRMIAPGQPDTMLRVKECLDRGEVVGMLGDRPLNGERTQSCRFLGEAARFPLGPLLLAATLGVPVVLFFGIYHGGARYDIHFEMLSEGERVERERRSEVAARWLETYVARLEHYTRAAPYNWFNFYDFWDAGAR